MITSGGSRISLTGVRQPLKGERGGATYYLASFFQKLHENEEILAQRVGGGGREGPSDPALITTFAIRRSLHVLSDFPTTVKNEHRFKI